MPKTKEEKKSDLKSAFKGLHGPGQLSDAFESLVDSEPDDKLKAKALRFVNSDMRLCRLVPNKDKAKARTLLRSLHDLD